MEDGGWKMEENGKVNRFRAILHSRRDQGEWGNIRKG
jgi:hypothetical protein